VANWGRPRRLMLGDMAKWRVRGQWQTGGGVFDAQRQVTWQRGGWWQTKGILNARRRVMWQSGGCEGSGRPGEASSTLSVK